MLFHLQALKKFLGIGVGTLTGRTLFGGMKDAEKRAGTFGDPTSFFCIVSKGLSLQVQSGYITS